MESVIVSSYLKSLNLAKDDGENVLSTRANRRATTFLDVNKMFCEENGQKRELTEGEQRQTKIEVFHDFLNQHFKVGESYGPFYGFRIEDLNQSVFDRVGDYSKVFFEETKNLITSGEKKITNNKDYDISHINKLANIFNKEWLYEQRNYRRTMLKLSKKYPELVKRLANINLKYQQKQEKQELMLNVAEK